MWRTRRLDQRSVIFGLSGCLALFVHLEGMLLSLGMVVLARVAFGERVRAVAFAIGSLAPIAALALYLFGLAAYDDWRHREPFDSSLWRQTAQVRADVWPVRLGMVEDLLAGRDLRGLDRRAVLDLLGPPDMTRGDRSTQIWYQLGVRRGRLDADWLTITFNDEDRVRAFERTH